MKDAASVPDAKADGKKLREFFREVAPDHDEEKVYASDMKKVIVWYQALKDLPLFNDDEPGAVAEEAATVAEEQVKPVEEPIKAETAPAKSRAKKAAAKKA
jgi:hypothetical protein